MAAFQVAFWSCLVGAVLADKVCDSPRLSMVLWAGAVVSVAAAWYSGILSTKP